MHRSFCSLLLPLSILTTSAYAADDIDSTNVVSIDAVTEIAGLMDKYGIIITILAVFLVILLGCIMYIFLDNKRSRNSINSALEEATKTQTETTNKLLETLITLLTTQNKKENNGTANNNTIPATNDQNGSDKQGSLIKGYINASCAFKDASRITMSKTDADRVAIYLLHNGNHSYYGYNFLKMTCVSEWTNRGIGTSRGIVHNGVPMTVFDQIFNALYNDGEFVVGDIDEYGILTDNSQINEFLAGTTVKIKAIFFLLIKDSNGNPAAFIGAEFSKPHDFSDKAVYDNVKEALETMRDNIIFLITDNDYRSGYEENKDS